MIINHNMNAMNAHRNMVGNTGAAGKSMEKLSSGLRINRAGDDAAGLAISEKMRGQIRGLDQASRNAQDGISMIQTAEGALTETHSILQRMRELSVQSSNGTNTDDDRTEIQKEVEQLKQEIDRIGNDTEFNTKKLLNGELAGSPVAGSDKAAVIGGELGGPTSAKLDGIAAADDALVKTLADGNLNLSIDGAKINVNIVADDYKAFSAEGKVNTTKLSEKLKEDINKSIDEYNKANGTKIEHINVTANKTEDGILSIESSSKGSTSTVEVIGNAQSEKLGLTATAGDGKPSTAIGSQGKLDAAGAAKLTTIQATDKLTMSVDGIDLEVTLATTGGKTYAKDADMSGAASLSANLEKDLNDAIKAYNDTVPSDKKLDDVKVSVKDGALVVESQSSKEAATIGFGKSEASNMLGISGTHSSAQGGGVDFQIGSNQGQSMKVTVSDMRSEALEISKIDVSKKEGADEAITVVDNAIKKVSAQRSNLGAVQNRLEHTVNNLGTSSENLQAAESRVRDVDMAKEMMTFSKNNILQQAAQAMLAQANQQPQGVLQLLR